MFQTCKLIMSLKLFCFSKTKYGIVPRKLYVGGILYQRWNSYVFQLILSTNSLQRPWSSQELDHMREHHWEKHIEDCRDEKLRRFWKKTLICKLRWLSLQIKMGKPSFQAGWLYFGLEIQYWHYVYIRLRHLRTTPVELFFYMLELADSFLVPWTIL